MGALDLVFMSWSEGDILGGLKWDGPGLSDLNVTGVSRIAGFQRSVLISCARFGIF